MKIREILKLKAAEIYDYFRNIDLDDHTIFHYIQGPVYVNPASKINSRIVKKSGIAIIYTKRVINLDINIERTLIDRIILIGPGRELSVVFWRGKAKCVIDPINEN